LQSLPALAEWQRPQIGAVKPQKVECDVDRAARAPEKIVELRAAGLVGGDHLTIEDRLVDAKLGHDVATEGRGDLPAQRIEPGEGIPSSRDQAAAPALDIAHRAKPIVFRIEQPVAVVERLLAPGWRDRLYPRKWRMWRILGVGQFRAPSRIWSGAGPVHPTPAAPRL
jgi:hypothetical protein